MLKSDVKFQKRFDWGLCPVKPNKHGKSPQRNLKNSNFRWMSFKRTAGSCPPYQMGSQLGWFLLSPVDVTLRPFVDYCFNCSKDEIGEVVSELALAQVWHRENCYVGVQENLGLRFFDYWDNDEIQAMFLPNGEGTLEWKLGIDISAPEGVSLLIQDAGCEGFTTLTGLISAKQLKHNFSGNGISIAVKPNIKTKIKRGDVVAHVLLVDDETVLLNR